MSARRAGIAIAICLACWLARPGDAQIRSSERGTVSQEVDGTRITIDYGRPQLRGRVAFPDVTPWGSVWTPGANWATTIEVNHPFTLDGRAIPAGKYSVWMVPEPDEWTIYLNPDWHRFHESRPKVASMPLSWRMVPATGPATEMLTFDFPVVDRTGAILQFRWGNVLIPMRIDVPPSLAPGAMTAVQAAAYVGEYTRIEYGDTRADSTIEPMSIVLKDGRLHGVTPDPEFEFAFIAPPTPGGPIYLAFLDHGEIADIELSTPVTRVRQGNRVMGFTVGASKTAVWFRGERK